MPNYYGIFFSDGKQVVRLPVNPETLPLTHEADTSSYNVLGLGEIILPRTPKLRTVTISGFFPGRPFSGVLTQGGFKEPSFYIDFIRKALDEKTVLLCTPVRYYEDGTPFLTGDTGFPVLVTKFQLTEKGGETGDFYYTLELSEYRDYSPQKMVLEQPVPAAAAPTAAAAEPAREAPKGQLYVGLACVANGDYFATSYGEPPKGHASGRRVIISRIVDESRAKPVHINSESGGALGWITADGLSSV